MPAGRPTDYTLELAAEICELIGDGKSLREVCSQEGMPKQSTIYQWLVKHTEFADMYTKARETQADTLADELLVIADDATNDWMERQPEDKRGPGWDFNGEHWKRSQLRLDARKWIAAKLKPRKYGDKLDLTSGGDKIAWSDRAERARAKSQE